jgi:hypothetical protein
MGRLSIQKTLNARFKRVSLLELTLPDNHDRPTRFFQSICLLAVACFIGCDLRFPVSNSALGQPAVATGMAVPEAPVNENYLASADESQIGFSGQVLSLKGVTVSEPMNY